MEGNEDMQSAKASLFKKTLFLLLSVCLLPSCGEKESEGKAYLSFRGELYSFVEAENYVYIVSRAQRKLTRDSTFYISSYEKNGQKLWETQPGFDGTVYPLKDGRFFYAARNGKISACDSEGRVIWEKKLCLDTNSNYLLNADEELMVNTRSSPTDSTVYQTIGIDGTVSTSPPISSLATCFTYNYPLGGTITEGFTADYRWHISRVNEDFSVEWTYTGADGEGNFYIGDISDDGRILFTGTKTGTDEVFLKELDAQGRETKTAAFQSAHISAAYFQDKIAVSADKFQFLDAELRVASEFEARRFSRLKALDDSFFSYSPGSYERGASVLYDGYCRRYDDSGALISSSAFQKSDHFIEIGETGIFYYRMV